MILVHYFLTYYYHIMTTYKKQYGCKLSKISSCGFILRRAYIIKGQRVDFFGWKFVL